MAAVYRVMGAGEEGLDGVSTHLRRPGKAMSHSLEFALRVKGSPGRLEAGG